MATEIHTENQYQFMLNQMRDYILSEMYEAMLQGVELLPINGESVAEFMERFGIEYQNHGFPDNNATAAFIRSRVASAIREELEKMKGRLANDFGGSGKVDREGR